MPKQKKSRVFTKKEVRELTRLLRKIARNGYWVPGKAFETLHGVMSAWAPELVITRRRKGRTEILLSLYDGGERSFAGKWNIPGGYNRFDEPDIQATCARIARREIGTAVTYKRVIGAYKWREGEHPYGRPLSLYVACRLRGNFEETPTAKFFPVNALPPLSGEPHRRFIEKHFVE